MRLGALLWVLVPVVSGCVAGAYQGVRELDAGTAAEEAPDDCGTPSEDGGVPCLTGAEDPCLALVERSCEPSCQDAPGCAAAELTQRWEPDACAAALEDAQTFPTCTASPCDTLVERTCGGLEPTPECVDSPGCSPSQVLRQRATDPAASSGEIADAVAACAQALEDAVVFSACP